jgi:hypothetical protein
MRKTGSFFGADQPRHRSNARFPPICTAHPSRLEGHLWVNKTNRFTRQRGSFGPNGDLAYLRREPGKAECSYHQLAQTRAAQRAFVVLSSCEAISQIERGRIC